MTKTCPRRQASAPRRRAPPPRHRAGRHPAWQQAGERTVQFGHMVAHRGRRRLLRQAEGRERVGGGSGARLARLLAERTALGERLGGRGASRCQAEEGIDALAARRLRPEPQVEIVRQLGRRCRFGRERLGCVLIGEGIEVLGITPACAAAGGAGPRAVAGCWAKRSSNGLRSGACSRGGTGGGRGRRSGHRGRRRRQPRASEGAAEERQRIVHRRAACRGLHRSRAERSQVQPCRERLRRLRNAQHVLADPQFVAVGERSLIAVA
ncbi:MAG: hypothetical protein MZV65_48035 [Chromatiales bacterium]|nr:hypothetical protein [Chromatiales bacterium]